MPGIVLHIFWMNTKENSFDDCNMLECMVGSQQCRCGPVSAMQSFTLT